MEGIEDGEDVGQVYDAVRNAVTDVQIPKRTPVEDAFEPVEHTKDVAEIDLEIAVDVTVFE